MAKKKEGPVCEVCGGTKWVYGGVYYYCQTESCNNFVRARPIGRGESGGPNMYGDPSPWQENAVRALEDA